MDTKKLRQKILDLAIRGKLVPQDPNDEPASVLLERIRAEKEKLIKEGKIKRSKAAKTSDTPHYEQVPFEVPEGWMWTTLGEVFTLQAGKNITAQDISQEQNTTHHFPCYGGNGIRGYVSSYNRKGHFPLIGRQGALCGNINEANGEFYATEHAVVVDTYCDTNIDWSINVLAYLNLNQYATSTAQPGLSVSTINDVMIPVPPLKEQQRISQKINIYFSLIDQIEQGKTDLETAIKQTKSKILDLAIHGKLVPQDPNDEPASELLKRINPQAKITCDNRHYTNPLPGNWCWTTFSTVCNLITGSTPNKSCQEYYGGDFPFYKPSDLDAGRHVVIPSEYLTNEGRAISRIIPQGSTAICCIGSIGKCGFIEKEGCTNQQINVAVPSNAIQPLYLYYFCNSTFFNENLLSGSSAITISIVNKSKLGKMLISIPPYQEQKRIVSKIEELFSFLDKMQESIAG